MIDYSSYSDSELKKEKEYYEMVIADFNNHKDKAREILKKQIEDIDNNLRYNANILRSINKEIHDRLEETIKKYIASGKLGYVTQYDLRKAYKNPEADVVLQKLGEWWFDYDHTECCHTHCDGECRDCNAHDIHWEEFRNKYNI